MIIVIIIGVGDTGENGSVPALSPFFPDRAWGNMRESSPSLSHVLLEFIPMGIRGNLLHNDSGSFPQAI